MSDPNESHATALGHGFASDADRRDASRHQEPSDAAYERERDAEADERRQRDEVMQQAIATKLGWLCFEQRDMGRLHGIDPQRPFLEGRVVRVPDYPHDLNAMAEAEKTLTDDQRVHFRLRLMNNSDGPNAKYLTVEAAMCHATATERADAFCAVMGIKLP